jgi:thiol:disulfide interchange protein
MEHSTFAAPAVKQRLAGFHQVRLQAERPNQTPAKEVLDYFNVLGLPSFVILTPNGTTPPSSGKASVTAALSR